MAERFDFKRLLQMRKLTRAVQEHFHGQLLSYLATLSPLLRPKAVLGEFVEGRTGDAVKGAESAFRDLSNLWDAVAPAKPFELRRELKPPVEVLNHTLFLSPVEYTLDVKTASGMKRVTITSPLRWALSYSGFTPTRLRELLADKGRNADEVARFVSHTLLLHVVLTRQTGVAEMLRALHFPVGHYKLPEFGNLPISTVGASISTESPPDDVIAESTEISGMDAFEEVVNPDDILRMRDPLRERLLEIAAAHGVAPES